MAINLTHRPDLEAKIELLAQQLKFKGRGRKTNTIERALDALEEKLKIERPSPSYIRNSLGCLSEGGERFQAWVYRDRPYLEGKPISVALQDELYDEQGLPK